MTELAAVAIATSSSVVTGVITTVAVIDPNVSTIALALIGAVVTITTIVFAFKTASLNAKLKLQEEKIKVQDVKVAEVIKTSDGMKDALMRATAKASEAEGMVKGQQVAAAAAAIHAAGVLEGQQTPARHGVSGQAVLKEIEKHTGDTALNTARTEATVQEIQKKNE